MVAAAPADKVEGQVIRRVSVPMEAYNAALVPAIGPSQPRPHMSQLDAGNEETIPT